MERRDTIAAVATGQGGAIAVVRLSGDRAIGIGDAVFLAASGKKLGSQKGYTIHYGTISDNGEKVDDVLVSLFCAPRSYTGEDMVEISCHASGFIRQKILSLCVNNGARIADPGEFTMRAFMNGKMELSQAEAVADIIASGSKAAHQLASNQMRSEYAEEFRALRDRLVGLASLLELELDFSEEDVEFADREKLTGLIALIEDKINSLISSFSLGNIIKTGVPVAIAGAPNAGKSTLLNAILKEERALVSDIAGTTRDTIEDTIVIGGVEFRFIDTAGIRHTEDRLENMGIERTMDKILKASVVLLIVDIRQSPDAIADEIKALDITHGQSLAVVVNKIDLLSHDEVEEKTAKLQATVSAGYPSVRVFALSAKKNINIEKLLDFLAGSVDLENLYAGDPIVFNIRHYEVLRSAAGNLARAREGLAAGLAGDLLSQDIHEALHHLGTITGEITSDDILESIFSKFCIGK